MLSTVVDTEIAIPFQVRDLDNAPVEGLVDDDFTSTAFLTSATGTTAACEIDEVSDGAYVLTVTPDETGVWYVTWETTIDGDPYPFDETLQVLAETPQIATDVTGASSVVNDEVTVILPYFDDEGEPVTGATITATAYLTSDPTVTAEVEVEGIADQSGRFSCNGCAARFAASGS
jgi:hypothetical protein